MTNPKTKVEKIPSRFLAEDKFKTNLNSLHKQVKSLIDPFGRLDKIIRSNDSGSEDFPWPELFACLHSLQKAWESHGESLVRNLDLIIPAIEESLLQHDSSLKQRFLEKINKYGWSVQGSWPEPVVEQVVFVKIDFSRGKAIVNGKPVRIFPFNQLIKTIEKERSRLLAEDFDPLEWLDELFNAYERARSARGAAEGEPIPVFDILPLMAWARQKGQFSRNPSEENFVPYSMVQFRAELTRVLALDVTQTKNGHRLEITSGSFSKDTIFMYFPKTRHLGSCGRIAFTFNAEIANLSGCKDV